MKQIKEVFDTLHQETMLYLMRTVLEELQVWVNIITPVSESLDQLSEDTRKKLMIDGINS